MKSSKIKNQKRKVLGVASTNYHLLVFLFIKDAFLKDADVDLVVTDKTPGLYKIYKSRKLHKYFNNVYFADARKIKNPYKSAVVTLWESMVSNPTTQAMLEGGPADAGTLPVYDDLYFASPGVPDEIVKELIKSLILRNKNLKLHRFEDGFASYTKPPVSSISTALGKKMYQTFKKYDISKMENELLMFEPSLAEDNVADTLTTGFTLKKIPKSEERISLVISQIKDILQFEAAPFKEKIMFLGQGTQNGMQNPVTYRSLIWDIADFAGPSNFIIKPHPRGEHDIFSADMRQEDYYAQMTSGTGSSENHAPLCISLPIYNDACPFELAIADGITEDKILISYYSTACVSGKLLFNSKAKIIFLYPLSKDSFNEKCDYENYFTKLCKICDNVYIARTKDELFSLLAPAIY